MLTFSYALVVQRIGHKIADLKIEVRFLSRAHERSEYKREKANCFAFVEESKGFSMRA